MKKKAAFLLFLSFSFSLVFAQDIILKKNGDELKAKIQEILPDEIIFRKWENLEGPLYTIPKEDVFIIRYANGLKEVIGPLSSSKLPKPAFTKIEERESGYYMDGKRLRINELYSVIEQSGNDAAIAELKLSKNTNGGGKALITSGISIGVLGTCGVILFTELRSIDRHGNQAVRNLQVASIAVNVVGAAMIIAGSIVRSSSSGMLHRAVVKYNAGLKE